jgi:hypothetical protein
VKLERNGDAIGSDGGMAGWGQAKDQEGPGKDPGRSTGAGRGLEVVVVDVFVFVFPTRLRMIRRAA